MQNTGLLRFDSLLIPLYSSLRDTNCSVDDIGILPAPGSPPAERAYQQRAQSNLLLTFGHLLISGCYVFQVLMI
jgi:hypothetical protein